MRQNLSTEKSMRLIRNTIKLIRSRLPGNRKIMITEMNTGWGTQLSREIQN